MGFRFRSSFLFFMIKVNGPDPGNLNLIRGNRSRTKANCSISGFLSDGGDSLRNSESHPHPRKSVVLALNL